ncbi:hypothetical protein [uncultured Brevundimonas sp.]|uniref:hypothetical protein n=1 Tax=uncultured Brevundimonas sp. TaxID=213418 RepID=UPI0025D53090|nr:hypothetical protein [uncultured Brevundimonas sp.]
MTQSNIDSFKKDLDALIHDGVLLRISLQRLHDREAVDKQIIDHHGEEAGRKILKGLGNFGDSYQKWYSEALAVVKQLLPERLEDFKAQYNRPKGRKDISAVNYVLEDAVQGLTTTRSDGKVLGQPITALPRLDNQAGILEACKRRFESSLFDIRQLVQADLFDSELDGARELLRNGYGRAGGAVAGVVLEHHLQQVIGNHKVALSKKNPGLSDLSSALKDGNVIDVAEWRRLQHLGDLRNKCDHKKTVDPTRQEVEDLIAGVERTIKTLF